MEKAKHQRPRPQSAMEESQSSSSTPTKESWLKRSLVGRTPSLPSSLGKKKPSFLKKFHCRKISAPSFASTLRHLSSNHRQAEESEVVAKEVDKKAQVEDWVDYGYHAPASPVILDKAYSIIAYRKKLRQQRYEMKQLKAEHQCQLEEISNQLLQFEASLRAKEKLIEKNMYAKDQVILKQQKLIKKLLRKRDSSNDLLENTNVATANTSAPTAAAAQPQGESSNEGGLDEALNDSDSAIILEDNALVEVSLTVPNLPLGTATTNEESSPTKVARSVSEVVSNRKSSKEMRISNRQKLFLLKRHHSGYLKRPEILETVYSVEEDGEQQQQQSETVKNEEDPNTRRESLNSISLANIFRKRLDSDLTTTTTGSECSTDDESLMSFNCRCLLLSETESLQSSSKSICHCLQCRYSASAPASRRSSYGSNVISTAENSTAAKTYYRVMNNHKSVTKPKDVKFRRINKAKSRSLEELRGQLKTPTRSSSTNDDDMEDLEDDLDSDSITPKLARLRSSIMKQKSLSLEGQESTD